jgi:hypothetical protein
MWTMTRPSGRWRSSTDKSKTKVTSRIETTIIDEKPSFEIEENVDYTTERIIKIEGTEYLPSGFIELEPLLFKNEYNFGTVIDERNFDEDQRRTKELRRQQYNNRNFAKIRDVIIYKIEYLKRRATQILERWYAETDQPMDPEQIEEYSKELELDPSTFKKMHDIFREDRSLFGRNNDELNKIIYNDSVQRDLTKNEVKNKPASNEKSKEKVREVEDFTPGLTKEELEALRKRDEYLRTESLKRKSDEDVKRIRAEEDRIKKMEEEAHLRIIEHAEAERRALERLEQVQRQRKDEDNEEQNRIRDEYESARKEAERQTKLQKKRGKGFA